MGILSYTAFQPPGQWKHINCFVGNISQGESGKGKFSFEVPAHNTIQTTKLFPNSKEGEMTNFM